MENASAMRVIDRFGNDFQVSGRSPGGQGLIPDELRKRAPLDKVHREKRLAFMLADIVNGDKVRVLQAGCGCRFGPKPLHQIVAAELAEREQFECDNAVQIELPRFVNGAHAALGDLLQHFVIAKPPTRDLRSMNFDLDLLPPEHEAQLGPAQLEQALGTKSFRSVPGQFPVALIANARWLHIRYRSIGTQK